MRKPKFEKEQRDADKWAHKTILPAFSKVFPKSKFEREWKEIMHQFYESEISNKTVNQSGNKFGVDR